MHGGSGGWKEGENEGKIPPFQAKSQRLPKTHRFLRFTSPPEAFCRRSYASLGITASVANQRSAQASASKGSDNQRGASISGRRNAPPEPGNGAPGGGAGRSEQPRRQIPCAASCRRLAPRPRRRSPADPPAAAAGEGGEEHACLPPGFLLAPFACVASARSFLELRSCSYNCSLLASVRLAFLGLALLACFFLL